jgi:hypothetical protein
MPPSQGGCLAAAHICVPSVRFRRTGSPGRVPCHLSLVKTARLRFLRPPLRATFGRGVDRRAPATLASDLGPRSSGAPEPLLRADQATEVTRRPEASLRSPRSSECRSSLPAFLAVCPVPLAWRLRPWCAHFAPAGGTPSSGNDEIPKLSTGFLHFPPVVPRLVHISGLGSERRTPETVDRGELGHL